MPTKISHFRLNAEDKAHLKNIRESMELQSDTGAVRLALKKLSEQVERVKAQRRLQEL